METEMEIPEETLAKIKAVVEENKEYEKVTGHPIFTSHDLSRDIGLPDHLMGAYRYALSSSRQPQKRLPLWKRWWKRWFEIK